MRCLPGCTHFDRYRSRMVERDAVKSISSRGVTGRFNSFNFSGYRRTSHIRKAGGASGYIPAHGGGIPIVERDVLIIDQGASGGDGSGVAGLVVLVTRGGVFGGDGKASRVVDHLEAVASVGAVDRNLIGGIDGRPYPGGGDVVSFRGVGGPGRGNDFAPYGGSVDFGELYHRYGLVTLFSTDADCNGCVSRFLHGEGECSGVLFHLEGEAAVGAGFHHVSRGGGGGDFRIRHPGSG